MSTKLIIGDVNSIYVQSLIDEIKKNYPTSRIDCLSTTVPNNSLNAANNLYQNKLSYWMHSKFGMYGFVLGWFIGLLWWLLFRRSKIKYDVVQIHFLGVVHFSTIFLYRLIAKRTVAVLWGSDVFKAKYLNILRFMLLSCDVINCTSDTLESQVQSLLERKKCIKPVIKKNVFGLTVLEELKRLETNFKAIDVIKRNLGISGKKKIVTIGHNASKNQQHYEIIRALTSQGNRFENCQFLIPLTYNGSDEYISLLKNELYQSGLDYLLFENYLSLEEVSVIRIVTDIFIQLQLTDALSGAMREHLFAKNTVITGCWLNYPQLTECGVKFITIQSVEDIASVLFSEIEEPTLLKNDKNKNREEVYRLSSWKGVISGWNDL